MKKQWLLMGLVAGLGALAHRWRLSLELLIAGAAAWSLELSALSQRIERYRAVPLDSLAGEAAVEPNQGSSTAPR